MTLRTLFATDVPQLLVIEQTVSVVPWTHDVFKACLDAGYVGWVLEKDKKVIAFILVSLTPEECHILNLAVARDHQHQGHGLYLLNHALIHAKTHGVSLAFLEVRESNSRAISLYKKMKFHMVGERKDYYPTISGRENAQVYALSLHDYKAPG